jgi:hypothetical protein
VDGVDSLSLYKDSLETDFEFHYDESTNQNRMRITGISNFGKTIFIDGHWTTDIEVAKFNIEIYGRDIGTGPFGK